MKVRHETKIEMALRAYDEMAIVNYLEKVYRGREAWSMKIIRRYFTTTRAQRDY